MHRLPESLSGSLWGATIKAVGGKRRPNLFRLLEKPSGSLILRA
ncbi:hypothetical protein HMPREF9371_0561 [Neisseria shayeganii 871]|uniref:Uncharacterized protein n=1 Tax=Neisseria shayeganii 871 TaxID=1032488 RepID=G4CG22_9NEIS|nr:hypothetical protein HMPREF9371_0561 [Neisseria shayeganii 871]